MSAVIRASAIVPLVYALASRVTLVHRANVLPVLMTALDTDLAALTRTLLMTGLLLKPRKSWDPLVKVKAMTGSLRRHTSLPMTMLGILACTMVASVTRDIVALVVPSSSALQ